MQSSVVALLFQNLLIINTGHPEAFIKQAIPMNKETKCNQVVRHIRPWARGRTIAVVLPADKFAQVATRGLDTNTDYFTFFVVKSFVFRLLSSSTLILLRPQRRS